MHPSESFTYLSDFQLSRIMGGSNQPKDYSIDLKSLGVRNGKWGRSGRIGDELLPLAGRAGQWAPSEGPSAVAYITALAPW